MERRETSTQDAPWAVLVESSSDILMVNDPDGTIRLAGGAVRDILGVDGEELTGTNPFRIIHPDDRDTLIEQMLELRDHPDEVRTILVRAAAQPGGWRWLELNARNLTGDPRVNGFVATARDVTDRVEAAAALRASEQRHRELVNEVPYGMAVLDAQGNLLFANPAAARLAGLDSPEQVVGRSMTEFVAPADQGLVAVRLRQATEGQHPAPDVFSLLRPNGEEVVVASNALPYDWGGTAAALCVMQDVTRLRQAEQALRTSEERHRELVAAMPHGMVVLDAKGVVRFANPSVARLVHVPDADAVVGRSMTEFLEPPNHGRAHRHLQEALAGAHPPPEQYELRTEAGDLVVVISTALPYEWEDGEPAVLVMLQDVTELRRAEQEREAATEQWRLLLESSAEGIIGLDTEGRMTFLNPAAEQMLGVEAESVLGHDGHALFHHSAADGTPIARSDCACQKGAREGVAAVVTEQVFWRTDGTPLPVDYRVNPLRSDEPSGAVLTFTDVSERVQARRDLERVADFQRAVLDSLPAQTAVVDETGRIVAVNAAWDAFMRERGGTPETCGVGVDFLAVCDRVLGPDSKQARAAAAGLRAMLAGDSSHFSCDVTCDVAGQETLHFSLQMVPLRSEQRGVVIGYSDITDRKRLEVASAHRATHDELTGLPNRTLLLERLEHALQERGRAPLAVLFVDLDHFKLVNDGYGHEAGDQVLRELARRLCSVVRPSDTVVRLAGDEFVVVCEHLPYVTEAQQLADRIIGALARPFPIAGTEITLGASVGIAVAEDHRTTPDELLGAADQAMFHAKAAGRNRSALFDEGVHQSSRRRLEQALALRRLVDEHRLAVHYQPVVDLTDGRITGVEALLRWEPVDHLPNASTAVALAEEIGLIGIIDRWVLRTACEQAVTFVGPDGEPLRLSVNLAPQQLDRSIIDHVAETAAVTGYPLTSLTLEITERTVMADPAEAISTLGELRTLGVSIAIDDFGNGQSSLSQLRDLPIDTLKIDSGFVANLAGTAHDDRLIRAIIELARALSLGVIAEGVERSDQRHRLLDLGCREGQGHLFSRARSAEDIRALLG